MAEQPPPGTPARRVGLRLRCEYKGRSFSRMNENHPWIEDNPASAGLIPAPSTSAPSPFYLSLVLQMQGEKEPNHWSLYVSQEGEPGLVYQVKGDAENMQFKPSDNKINIVQSRSFLDIYELAKVTDRQMELVKQVAEQESPPRAPNRHSVKENCQGWTLRVLARLHVKDIVPTGKLNMAKSMQQPLYICPK